MDNKNKINCSQYLVNKYKERIRVLKEGILEKEITLDLLKNSQDCVLVYTEMFNQGHAYQLKNSIHDSEALLTPVPGKNTHYFYYDFGFDIKEVFLNGVSIDASFIQGSVVDYQLDYLLALGTKLNFEVYARACDTPSFQKEIQLYSKSIFEDRLFLLRLESEFDELKK